VNVEGATPVSTMQGLIERGHDMAQLPDSYPDFGAGQFIWRLGAASRQGYVAASDWRRDGQAVGF
jgi:gamma-glutamyltranspeptidase / glutathione hydrolase